MLFILLNNHLTFSSQRHYFAAVGRGMGSELVVRALPDSIDLLLRMPSFQGGEIHGQVIIGEAKDVLNSKLGVRLLTASFN